MGPTDLLGFRDFIIYSLLIFIVLVVTRANNMWGVRKGTKKAKVDVRTEKSLQKKRLALIKRLQRYEWVGKNIGVTPSEYAQKELKFLIERTDRRIPLLDRTYKPIELLGKMRLIALVSSFIGVMGLIFTHSLFFILFFLGLLSTSLFRLRATMKIADEDKKLNEAFPDFYLLIYNRLIQRTNGRLSPTLVEYLASINSIHGDSHKSSIKSFVVDLINNIEIYGDDSMAVAHLRDKYRSVTVINFCNLATQALKGVDNSDKLLSFKIELNQKRVDLMRLRADKLLANGSRAVYFIYVILFQFVVLSWYAKFSLSIGGLGQIFGF